MSAGFTRKLRTGNLTHSILKETDDVLWVSKICQPDISCFLFLPTCLFLLEDLVQASPLTVYHVSTSLSPLSVPPLMKWWGWPWTQSVFSAKNVDTTVLSHSKVGKYRPVKSPLHIHTPNFTLSPNWTRRTTTGIHADTDDVHPSGRFTGSSQDTKIKDDTLACLRSEPGWSKWPEQLMGTAGTAPAQQLAVAALQTCSINVTKRNAYLCQSLSITPSWAQRMKN